MDLQRRRQRLCRAALALALGVAAPVAAVAQGADALALTIEQNLSSIGFRLDLRPEQAAADLEAQGRQLQLLEQERPDHPALPGLKAEYERLQDKLAAATDPGDPSAGALGQLPAAPEGFTIGIDEVATLQQQAEAEMLRGNTEGASVYLDQAEAQMAALEERYRDDIPPGHVPLLVAKEKLAVLKDQLAAAKSD